MVVSQYLVKRDVFFLTGKSRREIKGKSEQLGSLVLLNGWNGIKHSAFPYQFQWNLYMVV